MKEEPNELDILSRKFNVATYLTAWLYCWSAITHIALVRIIWNLWKCTPDDDCQISTSPSWAEQQRVLDFVHNYGTVILWDCVVGVIIAIISVVAQRVIVSVWKFVLLILTGFGLQRCLPTRALTVCVASGAAVSIAFASPLSFLWLPVLWQDQQSKSVENLLMFADFVAALVAPPIIAAMVSYTKLNIATSALPAPSTRRQ